MLNWAAESVQPKEERAEGEDSDSLISALSTGTPLLKD